ncbi:MAG: type VI secretion system lipoprotein TssJ [Nitrospira sp.]|nr:type VI secretion system lipoprotein TssJ [Nitrospira sp.]MDH4243226.1 type VI secretion system lipoprotein TssJ [Nitrospira sp.]MDH4356025.1 type VI secretion system lipoprotein TssJ [Nitrospira sp.]MDH5317428.1 type VI secretion system lipoprotein TssJ [Nitrospira sp.]
MRKGICRFTKRGRVPSTGVLCLLVLLLGMGCSSETKKWRVQMVPTDKINLNDAGDSQPVLVRVYQLKERERFQQATFKALWKGDKEVLEDDLLDRKELMVHPEKKADLYIDLDVKHGAAYIGVMALFRQPDVEGWRQVAEATSSSLNPFTPKVKVKVDKNMIKVAN